MTFVRNVCSAYSLAVVDERLGTHASRVKIDGEDAYARHTEGKRTLVLGELTHALRSTKQEECVKPPYWYFSAYGNCPYGCQYCYLSGAKGVWFSPAVRVYLNLPEIMGEIDKKANQLGRPTAFFHGRLQDGLALDPLTGYSKQLVPFFANHRFARQIILTKSPSVDNLLELEHRRNTILCWSLNIPQVAEAYESDTPSLESRIQAMRRCADKGYPVRVLLQPIVARNDEWRQAYIDLVELILRCVPVARLGLGGVYLNGRVTHLARKRLGKDFQLVFGQNSQCERCSAVNRYTCGDCGRHYREVIDAALALRPDLEIGPCYTL